MADITVKELERLRGLTLRLGEVFDPQTLHLKLWMLGAATHIDPPELTIEINTETYFINFIITTSKFEKNKKKGAKTAKRKKVTIPKDFEKKCSSVSAWTHFLLGPWWTIQFSQNGKALYVIPPREKVPDDAAKKLRAVVAKDDTEFYGVKPQ